MDLIIIYCLPKTLMFHPLSSNKLNVTFIPAYAQVNKRNFTIPFIFKTIYVRNNLMTTHSDGTMIFLERFITGDNVEKIKKLDNQLVNLNLLLPYLERNKEVIAIDQEMKKIQAKNNITVKEFAEIYNISTSSQRDYRSRLQDALPYHQKVSGGKIIYVVEEVEIWFENQHR